MSSAGIDYFILNNLSAGPGLGPTQSYVWNGAGYTQTGAPANSILFQQGVQFGQYSLEWAIPNSQLATDYAFYGATISLHGDTPMTVDITNQGVTPEPTTLALLGLGLGGMWLKRRRKA